MSGLVAVVALAGCGGSNSGSELAQQYALEADQLVRFNQNAPDTPVWLMPTSGSATYSGVGLVGFESAPGQELTLAGRANVTANFGAGLVTTRITEIVDEGGNTASGAIQLVNAPIIGNRFYDNERSNLRLRGTEYVLDVDAVGGFGWFDASTVAVVMNGSAANQSNGHVSTLSGAVLAD